MASFWDTLTSSGSSLASKVLEPLSGGIAKGFENLVQTGINKTTSISNTIAKTTDPNKPAASQTSTPPTTTPATNAAQMQAKLGILIVVALVALLLFMRSKR